jgi:hypothetical protein
MTRSGFDSYGLVNYDSYKSKSLHWMRSKFIGSNRPCLKWEKTIIDIPSLSKDIYPLQSHFEPGRIFWPGSHPTLGANKRRQKWKGRLRTKVQRLRKSSKKEDLDWGHVRKLWQRLCESHIKKRKKEKKRKLPTLKGRSRINEGECLLSIGKTKEVSIK